MSATTPITVPGAADAACPTDPAEAIRFLRFIFEGASGYAEFRFFGPGRKPKAAGPPLYIELPPDEARVTEEVLRRGGGHAVAFGPAPRCRIPGRGRAGRDHDVLQAGCVWVNLDNSDAQGGAVEVVRRVREFPLRPSVAVNSGYGYHLYFAFHSPLRSGSLTLWSDMMGGLRRVFYTDESFGLSQVMRLPGTMNIKEKHPVPCVLWDDHSSWTRYSTEEVRDAVEKAFGGPPPRQHLMPDKSGARMTIFSPDFLHRRGISSELIKAVVTGSVNSALGAGAGSYDGESGRDFRIALALYEEGLSEDEIKAVFRSNPGGCGSNWARRKQGEKYLDATLRKARERFFDTRELSPSRLTVRDEDDGPSVAILPPGYVPGDDGSIWFNPPVGDADKKAAKPVKVCNSPISIAAIQENVDTGQISIVIEFEYLGKRRLTSLPRSHMSSTRQLVSALAGEGAPVFSNNARLVVAYLAAYEHAFARDIPHKKLTSRFGRGRRGGPFYFPGLSSSVEFAPDGPGEASLHRAYSSRGGSLGGWIEAAKVIACAGLMIPQAALLAAFVPPLQRGLGIPNFVFDLHGNTSTGKSTVLRAAASVYGRPHDPDSLVLQWMNTLAAVEQVAGVCDELPLFLDDAQHCPADVKRSVVYTVANGRGKGRGGRGGGIAEFSTWHTVLLSTSEEPLHEASPSEGVRGRILPLGGSEPPFPAGKASLVRELGNAFAANHGHAGETYLRHLNGWGEREWLRWARRYSALRSELLRGSSSNLIGRLCAYVAAVQVAGEIACPALGLPFEPDVVGAWLKLHLDERQSEQNIVLAALRALGDYYVANARHFAEGAAGALVPGVFGVIRKNEYVGFLRGKVEDVFRSRRWNTYSVLDKLSLAGALCTTEGDRFTKKVRVEGVTHRMVCVRWSAIMPDSVVGETG